MQKGRKDEEYDSGAVTSHTTEKSETCAPFNSKSKQNKATASVCGDKEGKSSVFLSLCSKCWRLTVQKNGGAQT